MVLARARVLELCWDGSRRVNDLEACRALGRRAALLSELLVDIIRGVTGNAWGV